ncbi:MAG: tetratricopeptide repeat protein [Candidatus Polarisedimenticolia bacterium]
MIGVRRSATLVLATLVLLPGTGCQSAINRLKANYAAKQGNEYYKAQDFNKAVQWYRYSTYLNPELPIAYHNAGLAYMALYKPGSRHPKDLLFSQKAIESLKRYIQYDPGDEEAKAQLLTVFLQAERYDEAAAFFEEEVKRQGDDTEAVSRLAQILGMIYSKKGDFESSLEWYKRRAELEKKNPEALYTIGVLCWEKVYKAGTTMELDRRKELVDIGLDYLKRAAAERENYFEAVLYINLLYREKAKVAQLLGNTEEFAKWMQEADAQQRIALDLRKKAMAKK